MTIAEALAVGIMRLRSAAAPRQIRESARADAQILLCEVLDADGAWLLAHGGEELDGDLLDVFGLLLDERMRGVPVPYLTHRAGFYGRDFYVDERALIPRPESEHLVEGALARRPSRILDVGTGSGALAVTLAAELQHACVTATDVSADALQVAERNAREHGVADRIEFVRCEAGDALGERRFDCIVANLPYIPTADVPQLPDPVAFEPRVALDGGPDGLAVYRRLIPRLGELAGPDGAVLLEAAPPTIGVLSDLLHAAYPGTRIAIGSDYAGLERFLIASLAIPAIA